MFLKGHGLLTETVKDLYLYAFQFAAKPVVIQQQLFVSTLTLLQLRLQLCLIVSTHLLEFLQLLLSLLGPGDRATFNVSKKNKTTQHMLTCIYNNNYRLRRSLCAFYWYLCSNLSACSFQKPSSSSRDANLPVVGSTMSAASSKDRKELNQNRAS